MLPLCSIYLFGAMSFQIDFWWNHIEGLTEEYGEESMLDRPRASTLAYYDEMRRFKDINKTFLRASSMRATL